MIGTIKDTISLLKSKKGGAGGIIAGIIIAIIIAAAIIIAVSIYTSNQTHPFWEIQ